MSDPGTFSAHAGQATWSPREPVSGRFVVLYALALASTTLMLIAPLLVTLALKIEDLVGADEAPGNLSLVVGAGALVALVANPVFGRLSDRTSSRLGMRRPWMIVGLVGGCVGVLVVAVSPSVPGVLVGWCIAQAFLNGLLAAVIAVLADQVPVRQRGFVSGVLGVCVPVASVVGTFLVRVFDQNTVVMFLAPCAVGAVFVLTFVATFEDRRLPAEQRPAWSLRDLASTFYVAPHASPDFVWTFVSRFLFVLAYALLITYQAYFLLDHVGSDEADVPHLIFLGTLASSVVTVVASLVSGRLSDRWRRRKPFVCTAALVYAAALCTIAATGGVTGYLVGMAIAGLGFGIYVAVDLALVADVLPDEADVAKDLGVFNIAGALPFSIGPVVATAVLALSGGSYATLYAVAGVCAVASAGAVTRVRRVR